MDAETSRWLGGLVVVAIAGLIGIIYGSLRKEDWRMAKNIHELRNWVDRWTKSIEARLRAVERHQDKDER